MRDSFVLRFWEEEDGQDLVEYSLLLAFIALAAIAILSAASSNITALWTDISDALGDATTAAS
jgi:Flp pilus assembly pilin Flp